MRARGFTVVELIITIVVITILLALGTVGLRSTLANARDAERKADAETIARGLERYYAEGNAYVINANPASPPYETKGTYPGVVEFYHMTGGDYSSDTDFSSSFKPSSGANIEGALPGVSRASYFSPNATTRSLFITGETNINTTTELNNGNYVYTPKRADNSTDICYGYREMTGPYYPCGSFILQYKKESGTIETIRSKH